MKKFDLTKGVVTSTEWVSRLAMLNLVWLLFSIPIITIIPATNTLFHLLNLWSNGETCQPIFKTFWHHFKTYFWKGYRAGLPVFIVFIILLLDQWYLNSLTDLSAWIPIYQYVLFFFSILFSLTALFYIALSQEFTQRLPVPKQLLTSLLVMVGHPLISLGLLVTVLLLLLVFSIWPAMLLFFSASGIGWATTLATKKAVAKTLQKQKV